MIQDRVKELREIVPNGAKVMHFFNPSAACLFPVIVNDDSQI
jgi:hypothetical protein